MSSSYPMARRRACRGPALAASLAASAAVVLWVLPAGCSKGQTSGWFASSRSGKKFVDQALEAPTPDERRKGVQGLAKSRDRNADWAIQIYETIARTDTDMMVRCAAMRALAQSPMPARVPLAIKVLESQRQKSDDVKPAEGSLRYEAARLLLEISRIQAYEEAQRDTLVLALMDAAQKDPDREVRLTAIEALGCYAQRPVPDTLISVMAENDDYAVQSAAEKSLIILTGVTCDEDAKKWRQWLESTKDPFERMGQTPDELRPENQPKPKWRRWDWQF